ncbi:MAG: DNA cytosine methyltransferase [Rhizobiaceae bacterium]|nr:DNA cytosine methyltransferase [Rhizobiaceae bacterium]
MKNIVPIIDIFAGPGGLGEGFCSFKNTKGNSAFESVLAAEMDKHAHKTLILRSFFRMFPREEVPESYYKYIAGALDQPYTKNTLDLWNRATEKNLCVQLGNIQDDFLFDKKIRQKFTEKRDWVLLGGPPCQAYSIIGRWRFRREDGNGHDLDRDDKAHLYKQYLRIIHDFCPTVFVMENVRGLLSSKYFDLIIADLQKPNVRGERYRLYSLISGGETSKKPHLAPLDYLIHAEKFGVPQRRHRVIIVGVIERIKKVPTHLKLANETVTVGAALSGLPQLRSGLSRNNNSDLNWYEIASKIASQKIGLSESEFISIQKNLKQNSTIAPKKITSKHPALQDWLHDPRLINTPNHETRGHMISDLERYYFASAFAKSRGRTPRDIEFPLELSPNHKSWKSNKFNDRFRVQVKDLPATTVVAHISKDGHSFIHPDPSQCRSLTVREAARLQTFPDNYYFEGPRTEQYRQVGNAVPPFLAVQVAKIVADLLDAG